MCPNKRAMSKYTCYRCAWTWVSPLYIFKWCSRISAAWCSPDCFPAGVYHVASVYHLPAQGRGHQHPIHPVSAKWATIHPMYRTVIRQSSSDRCAVLLIFVNFSPLKDRKNTFHQFITDIKKNDMKRMANYPCCRINMAVPPPTAGCGKSVHHRRQCQREDNKLNGHTTGASTLTGTSSG